MENISDTICQNKQVNMGRNVRTFRAWRKRSQQELGDSIGVPQDKISTLEKQKIIEDRYVEPIAKALDIPKELITSFSVDDLFKRFEMSMDSATLTNTSAENSHDTVNQQIVAEQNNEYNTTHNYNPLDEVITIYNKLIAEKDQRIMERDETIKKKDKTIDGLRKQIEDLKNKK